MADEKAKKKAQAKNRSRIVIETPGVKDSVEERAEAIRKRGGLYSDKVKIEPYSYMNQFGPFVPKSKVQRG